MADGILSLNVTTRPHAERNYARLSAGQPATRLAQQLVVEPAPQLQFAGQPGVSSGPKESRGSISGLFALGRWRAEISERATASCRASFDMVSQPATGLHGSVDSYRE